LYRVVGARDYRGHAQGTEFPARLDPRAENRAIMRGSIDRIGTVLMRPEHFVFPRGWLPQDMQSEQGKEA
jgi:hypothetical protein